MVYLPHMYHTIQPLNVGKYTSPMDD